MEYPLWQYKSIRRHVDINGSIEEVINTLKSESEDLLGASLEVDGYDNSASVYIYGYTKYPDDVAAANKIKYDIELEKTKEANKRLELKRLAELKAKYEGGAT